MNENLLFFTAATGRYQQFITPYIFFALYHNNNAMAEIMTDNVDKYVRKNDGAMRVLNKYFKNRFMIRDIPRGIESHTARFVVEPLTELEYTYMNDVDILILESNLVETHTAIMKEKRSYFSNRMRGEKKLTGVHFVRTNPWYEQTKATRDSNKLNDEEALYNIVNCTYGDPRQFTSDLRPIHGFHLSMNRPAVAPAGVASWKTGPEPLREIYRETIKSAEYKEIYPTFQEPFKLLLKELGKHVL